MSDSLNLEPVQIKNQNLFENQKYSVKLPEFEGPLDLLLHLVKTSEVNIYDIPIADITRQYLEYLSLLVEMDLDNISEFVEMAATLVWIKSKSMLPVELEYESGEEDPRTDLIAKILEYQKYKIAAGLLDERMEESVDFSKKEGELLLFDVDEMDENWKPLSVIDLVSAFAKVLNNKTSDGSYQVTLFEYNVEDKIDLIFSLLAQKESFNYFDLIREDMSKLELICTFLAILELVKQQKIVIKQHVIFGDIHVVRRLVTEITQPVS
jgi:segregation and condensation protein A